MRGTVPEISKGPQKRFRTHAIELTEQGSVWSRVPKGEIRDAHRTRLEQAEAARSRGDGEMRFEYMKIMT